MNYDEQFLEVMKQFNFDRCLTAMKALDWDYYDGEPTIERLKQTARTLYESVDDWETADDWRSVSSGGLKLERQYKGAELTLSFVIEYVDWVGGDMVDA